MNKHKLLCYVARGRVREKLCGVTDKIPMRYEEDVKGYREGENIYEIMKDWEGEYSVDTGESYDVFYPDIVYVR